MIYESFIMYINKVKNFIVLDVDNVLNSSTDRDLLIKHNLLSTKPFQTNYYVHAEMEKHLINVPFLLGRGFRYGVHVVNRRKTERLRNIIQMHQITVLGVSTWFRNTRTTEGFRQLKMIESAFGFPVIPITVTGSQPDDAVNRLCNALNYLKEVKAQKPNISIKAAYLDDMCNFTGYEHLLDEFKKDYQGLFIFPRNGITEEQLNELEKWFDDNLNMK